MSDVGNACLLACSDVWHLQGIYIEKTSSKVLVYIDDSSLGNW